MIEHGVKLHELIHQQIKVVHVQRVDDVEQRVMDEVVLLIKDVVLRQEHQLVITEHGVALLMHIHLHMQVVILVVDAQLELLPIEENVQHITINL